LFAKVNGKDVPWSPSALRFTNSENFFRNARQEVEELFRADRVNELHRNLREVSSASSSGEL